MVTAHVFRYINGLGQVLHPHLPSQFTNPSPGLVLSLNTNSSQMLPQHLPNQFRYYPNTYLTRTLVHSSLSLLLSQHRLSQDRCYPNTFLTKTLVLPSLNLVLPQHRLLQDWLAQDSSGVSVLMWSWNSSISWQAANSSLHGLSSQVFIEIL